MQDLYGEDRVAQIGTKLTMAMKSVCKDTGRALGYTTAETAKFASLITGAFDSLQEEYDNSEAIRAFVVGKERWWADMLKLEGHQRGVGVHAGGVVLSPKRIDTVVPLRRNDRELPTTQYDMKWIENYLVKFDILKLETLRLISRTIKLAGIEGEIDLDEIDYDDPLVYERVYKSLQLSGVFQVESDGMKDTINLIKPDRFSDLSALVALYRPGPMDFIPTYAARKHGQEPVSYQFESCKDILEETYGVLVYQEQAMQMSVELGGLSKGQSDYVRHGIAKKKIPEIEEWVGYMIYGSEEKNIPGALSKGYSEAELLKLKEEWIKFGEYCFNKSHSVAYAKISFQTAWLKCYYYIYFMAALISTSESKKDKQKELKHIKYQKELRENGIRILPPDILLSKNYWTPIKYEHPVETAEGNFYGEIRFSLTSISDITDKTFESIQLLDLSKVKSFKGFLTEVEKQKQIRTEVKATIKELNERLQVAVTAEDDALIDLINSEIEAEEMNLEDMGSIDLDKSCIENLVKAGAFDRFSTNRNLLLRQFAEFRGEEFEDMPNTTSKKDIALFEKEVLGCVASFESKWDKMKDGEVKSFTGVVKKVEPWVAKSSGKTHYYITLDIGMEEIQCTMWGYKMDRLNGDLPEGTKIMVKGEKGFNRLTIDHIQIK